MIEKPNRRGGSRPNAGRKRKQGRQRLELDNEAARNLYLLTKYRRSLFDKPDMTEEQVVASLVKDEWKVIQRENEPVEEMQEPYIV